MARIYRQMPKSYFGTVRKNWVTDDKKCKKKKIMLKNIVLLDYGTVLSHS